MINIIDLYNNSVNVGLSKSPAIGGVKVRIRVRVRFQETLKCIHRHF